MIEQSQMTQTKQSTPTPYQQNGMMTVQHPSVRVNTRVQKFVDVLNQCKGSQEDKENKEVEQVQQQEMNLHSQLD